MKSKLMGVCVLWENFFSIINFKLQKVVKTQMKKKREKSYEKSMKKKKKKRNNYVIKKIWKKRRRENKGKWKEIWKRKEKEVDECLKSKFMVLSWSLFVSKLFIVAHGALLMYLV